MEPVHDSYSIRNGTIVSALVAGSGTTLKYFRKDKGYIFLDPANTAYDPIKLEPSQVTIQGKLLAVWRSSTKF